MVNEFKKFALKGNVVDMAIGIIIGAAFSPIVKSLVDDVIMPPIGLLLGNVDFSNLFITLRQGATSLPGDATLEAARDVGAVTVNYGLFVNTVINFFIVALAVFMMVKAFDNLRKREEAKPDAPPKPREEVLLLRDIRDALRKA